MQHTTLIRRARRFMPLMAVLGMLGLTPNGYGQAGHRMMVIEQDDGSGPVVMHMIVPDLRDLGRPDYERSDLPLLKQKLMLDEPQVLVVQALLEGYLAQFMARRNEILPASAGTNRFEVGGIAAGGAHATADGGGPGDLAGVIDDELAEELGDLRSLDVDMEAGGGQVMVAITAGAGDEAELPPPGEGDVTVEWVGDPGAPPGGLPGSPEASVMISVAGDEDMELSEEARKKLEEKARAMAEKIQQRMEQAAEDGEPFAGLAEPMTFEEQRARMDELMAGAEKFRAEKEQLRRQFERDVQAQLQLDQLEQWPSVERALKRKKSLPHGRLDGERTDLTRVLDGLRPRVSLTEAAEEQLEAYETTLHAALVARDEFLAGAEREIGQAMDEGKFDRAQSLAERAATLRVAVRDVNDRSSRAIATQLDEEDRARFVDEVRRVSFPRVYRRTAAQKAFDAVRRLEDVAEETRTALDQVQEVYELELATVNERIRQAILRHQPDESKRMIEQLAAARTGVVRDPDDDPVRAAMKARRDLDERYMKQVYSLLRPDQVERLPKLPSERQRGPVIIRQEAGGA